MTIIEAIRDPRLLGGIPAFRDLSSWRPWLVFLCAAYGLPLNTLRPSGVSEDEALRIFTKHTGRTTYNPPPGGYMEVAAVVGRQSGKTFISATVAAFEAVTTPPNPDGTELYGLLVAQDARASLRAAFAYATAPFDVVPSLRAMVPSGWRAAFRKARKVDSLTLSTGMVLAAYPCRPAAVRGLRARVVILDELAFFRSNEGVDVGLEMLTAARPTLATTGGKLWIFSSPYGPAGALYDLHRRHYGRDDSPVLVWQATAPEMNPTLSADYLARMAESDPEAYRSEVLAEFRSGVATFLDAAVLAEAVDAGVRERAPRAGVAYAAFYDASGGRSDAAALAIAHRQGDVVLVDAVRAWPAPHSPAAVIAEAVRVLRAYGVREVLGDRYAGEFVAETFGRHDISYRPADLDRSGLYLEFLSVLNSGGTRLLDDPDTLRELRGLERRRGPSGRDRVDHRLGAHDDRAVVVAGVVAACRPDAGSYVMTRGSRPSDVEALARRVRDLAASLGVKLTTAAGVAITAATRRFVRTPADIEARTRRAAELRRARQAAREQREQARHREWLALAQRAAEVAEDERQRLAALSGQAEILEAIRRQGYWWPGESGGLQQPRIKFPPRR